MPTGAFTDRSGRMFLCALRKTAGFRLTRSPDAELP
jgi:hypothetical protein